LSQFTRLTDGQTDTFLATSRPVFDAAR